jgi:hypothetical protein
MTPWPLIVSACADCGIGTIGVGEWYMVHEHVWEEAWRGRRKSWQRLPGQTVLCIGCLEKRLGRTLRASDFSAVPINDPLKWNASDRMRDRLSAVASLPLKRRRGRKLKHSELESVE